MAKEDSLPEEGEAYRGYDDIDTEEAPPPQKREDREAKGGT